jgi:hypothetical protein
MNMQLNARNRSWLSVQHTINTNPNMAINKSPPSPGAGAEVCRRCGVPGSDLKILACGCYLHVVRYQ